MSRRAAVRVCLVTGFVAAATLAVLVVVASGPRRAAFRPAADTTDATRTLKLVTASAAAALPGATASIVAPPGGPGEILSITAPASAFEQPDAAQAASPPGPQASTAAAGASGRATSRSRGARASSDAFEAGDAGWRAGMIGAYAAAGDPALVGWTLSAGGAKVSAAAGNFLHAYLRISPGSTVGWPGQSLIGSVSSAAAQRQLESNLAVLKAVLGSDLLTSTTTVVPVGPSTFGLEVDLKVTSLAAIAPHIGDVWLGLTTGLTGGPTAAVEGLAVNVVDEAGERASIWRNGRDGDGGGIGNPALPLPSTPDVVFPDATGGPAVPVSASSGVALVPPGVRYVRERSAPAG